MIIVGDCHVASLLAMTFVVDSRPPIKLVGAGFRGNDRFSVCGAHPTGWVIGVWRGE